MQNLLFFFRITFICNVCLLLSALSKFWAILPEGFISSTVVVLGVGLAFFFNIAANLLLLVLLLRRKAALENFPKWLIIANFLFLIPEVYLLLR